MVVIEINVQVENCIFSQNSAEYEGGALGVMAGGLTIVNCLFDANSSPKGGAIVALDYASLRLERCAFIGNVADDGGALYLDYDASLTASSCTFVQNRAPRGASVTIVSSDLESNVVENCILAFGGEGEGIFWDGAGTLQLSCTDIYGNEGGDWVDSIASQLGVDGNLAADPAFCGDLNPDQPYSLTVESPCGPGFNLECGLVGAYPIGCPQTGVEDAQQASTSIMLLPCRPNPFHESTEIRFELSQPSVVALKIYDPLSRAIRTLVHQSFHPAGRHNVIWDGRNESGQPVATGIYYCKLHVGPLSRTGRLTRIQ